MAKDLTSRLIGLICKANNDYQMIEPQDRILLAFSGGKDSFSLLHLLHELINIKVFFQPPPTIFPLFIDLSFPSSLLLQIQNNYLEEIREYSAKLGYFLHISTTAIYEKPSFQ